MTVLLDLAPALDLTLETIFELAPSERIQWTNARRIESRWKPLHSGRFLAHLYASVTDEVISFRIEGRPDSRWAQSIVAGQGILVEVSDGDSAAYAVASGQRSGRLVWQPSDAVTGGCFPADTATLHSPAQAARLVWGWMTSVALPAGWHFKPALDGEHRVKR
jgi:hypothetical protein